MKGFTPELIQAKARLLKKHEQISAVILVRQSNGRYILLDGQLRTEGAKLLGWKSIRSVVVSMPNDLDQFSLLTFLGFEDLNPLDKAEAVFKEVTKSLDLEIDEVYTLLGTVIKRIERENNTKELAKLVNYSAEEHLPARLNLIESLKTGNQENHDNLECAIEQSKKLQISPAKSNHNLLRIVDFHV
ncbi:MAG: ParB N-terminal domain-containing protein [Nostoc sp.]|uniref:ParB/RepB/Spo0J family partition protein n=1 Tax=Nostoc sp. TaxID=1180 RepID=UPI002FFC5D51